MECGRRFHMVSAVVPAFNGSETLASCLSSLRDQGNALAEIIVVDDASLDSSWEIIRELAGSDPRFTLVHHDRNQGLSRTLNDGIARATGDAILIVQQDCELTGQWVETGLTLLELNYPCCISGNPTFRPKEMSRVDVAFGLLRNHFQAGDGKEEVAFSEFKCDLLPRTALDATFFETKFRISGEDQVLSMNLWDMGYPILRFPQLKFIQRSGNTSSIASQLKKELIYGRAEGAVLLRTAFRIASRSIKSGPSKRRLANRVLGLFSVLGLASLLLLIALGGGMNLLVFPLALLASRSVVLGIRGRTVRMRDEIPPQSLGLAFLLSAPADIVYVAALLSGLFAFLVAEKV